MDDADALAFFVPGIISGLCKAIYQSAMDAPGVRCVTGRRVRPPHLVLTRTSRLRHRAPGRPGTPVHMSGGKPPPRSDTCILTVCFAHALFSAAAAGEAPVQAVGAIATVLCIVTADRAQPGLNLAPNRALADALLRVCEHIEQPPTAPEAHADAASQTQMPQRLARDEQWMRVLETRCDAWEVHIAQGRM